MKGLNTLIKLHKRKLDELRRQMVALETQKTQLTEGLQRLAQELEREMELAGKQLDIAQYFAGFSTRMKKRQEEVAKQIEAVNRQIETLNSDIAGEFAELKKFEIAKKNALERAEEDRKRKETILLDDIAVQQFINKQKKGTP